MPTVITTPSAQLIDYHTSLTLGVIDAVFRWTDSIGQTSDRIRQFQLATVLTFAQNQSISREAALCTLLKVAIAQAQGVTVADLQLTITPFVPSPPSP